MTKRFVILAVILFAFGWYVHGHTFHQKVPLQAPLEEFPQRIDDWQGRSQFFSKGVLDQLRVSDYIMREYRSGDDRVAIYLGYYETQGEGRQIHSPRHCLPGSGWRSISEQVRTVEVDGQKINLIQAVYQKDEAKEVFLYWYQMKDETITSDYTLKMKMVLNSLKYGRNDAAFVRLSSPVTSTVDEAVQTVETFMVDFVPRMERFLPE